MQGVARAGFGCVELQPELGVPLMGYGARQAGASGRHDPIYARALYAQGRSGAGFLLVELDLCLMAVAQARDVRDRLAEATGLAPEEILVGCIHTHSAPDTALIQVLLGGDSPPEVRALLDAAVQAGRAAFESAEPARLGVGSAPACIGRNRRVQDGPVDPDALLLRFDCADGSPLAVLYLHGCHPTALGHDNLEISADWPGAASRAIEAALPGARAMFALGAHADVDPRTRGLLDLAIPDQSVGVSFEEMEELGTEIGEAIAESARAVETAPDFEVGSSSVQVSLPVLGGAQGASERETHLARRKADARAALGLPDDADPGMADWYRLLDEILEGTPPAERRERSARVRLLLRDQTARRIAGGLTPQVEVQVVRLGPVWLLGLPLEVTVDVGRLWREAAPGPASVVSIANGWMRYLPHADHFETPRAEECYEILNATFEPEAAGLLVAAARGLREKLAGNPGNEEAAYPPLRARPT